MPICCLKSPWWMGLDAQEKKVRDSRSGNYDTRRMETERPARVACFLCNQESREEQIIEPDSDLTARAWGWWRMKPCARCGGVIGVDPMHKHTVRKVRRSPCSRLKRQMRTI
jgi:hypothetical protein